MVERLADWTRDARRRTGLLAASLSPETLLGPRLAIVNPPLWELGHVAWFQERWILRHAAGRRSLLPEGDALYDSGAIPHDARWTLPLPPLGETLGYLAEVEDEVLRWLPGASERDLYYARLAVFHEDMHFEAMAFTRQTLGYAAPRLPEAPVDASSPDVVGDAEVPGGTFLLGAVADGEFAFDNEKWAHPVELAPFRIARAPVTQAAFAEFVDDAGYRRGDLWSAEGWRWREAVGAEHPVYWRRAEGSWMRRDFDRWVALEPERPVVNVCWFEADAFCRWAGRRLPSEAEWEAAAAGESGPGGTLTLRKRRFPWGDEEPTPARAHLDGRALRSVPVGAHPSGDSAFGCRQMLGNVWQWTASDFLPYPGFEPDPYREYSQPWFGSHKVLRGGSFATPARLVRNTWRNFYTPDRRDPWAGFRTCAT